MESHFQKDYGLKHLIVRTTSKIDIPIYISRIRPPFEAWIGLKPEVTHFRIFGSHAWTVITYEKRTALDPHSTECIFVGYPDGVKGYKLIDPSTDRLIIERSVQF
jgi:hypothetical protein